MSRWLKQLIRDSSGERRRFSGQGLVETAVMTPIMILMLMGTVDFARVFTANIQVTNAAREGAYYGSRSTENATDSDAVADATLADSPTIFGVAPSVASQLDTDGEYDQISVTVTYPFVTLFDYPGIPDSVDLSRTVTMRVVPQ